MSRWVFILGVSEGEILMTRESDLKRAIRDYLTIRGYQVYPVYNGAVYDPKIKRYRKGGTRPGVPDLYAIRPNICSIWIEVKSPGAKQRTEQIEFEQRIKGIPYCQYILARNLDDVIKALPEMEK